MTKRMPNLVGYPKTKAEFEASAKFSREMAKKVLDGTSKARDPQVIAEIYLAKAEEYERTARVMT